MLEQALDNVIKKGSEKQIAAASQASEAASKGALDYRSQKYFYQNELFKDIENLSANSKYTRPEQIYNELVKKYNTDKYTKVPKGAQPKAAFFKDGKFNLLSDTKYKGMTAFPTGKPDTGRTFQYLKNAIIANMLEKNTNPKSLVNTEVSKSLNKFYTGQGKQLSRQDRLIVNRFSKLYLQSGNKIRDYLTQRGLDFSKYRATNRQIQSTSDKLKTLLQNPNLDEATRQRYKLGIKKLDEISRDISQPLMKKYPNLFKKEKLVMEHKVATGIRNFGEYFPEEYILRSSLAPRSFNQYKAKVFDGPLIDLIEQYDAAPDRATKLDIQKQIKNLYREFNTASGGYLKDVKINFGKEGINIIDNSTPFTDLSKEQIVSQLNKNIKHHNSLASFNPKVLKPIKTSTDLTLGMFGGVPAGAAENIGEKLKKLPKGTKLFGGLLLGEGIINSILFPMYYKEGMPGTRIASELSYGLFDKVPVIGKYFESEREAVEKYNPNLLPYYDFLKNQEMMETVKTTTQMKSYEKPRRLKELLKKEQQILKPYESYDDTQIQDIVQQYQSYQDAVQKQKKTLQQQRKDRVTPIEPGQKVNIFGTPITIPGVPKQDEFM